MSILQELLTLNEADEKPFKSPNEGHDHETFQAWKTDKKKNPNGFSSYDQYQRQYGLHEYSVHRMDPDTRNSHIEDAPTLFSSDSHGDAHEFAYKRNMKDQGDYGVYQIRNNGYNGRYRTRPHDNQDRDSNGRFGKKKAAK
jgi:hypothetical protein